MARGFGAGKGKGLLHEVGAAQSGVGGQGGAQNIQVRAPPQGGPWTCFIYRVAHASPQDLKPPLLLEQEISWAPFKEVKFFKVKVAQFTHSRNPFPNPILAVAQPL